jgi:hypothetical protein
MVSFRLIQHHEFHYFQTRIRNIIFLHTTRRKRQKAGPRWRTAYKRYSTLVNNQQIINLTKASDFVSQSHSRLRDGFVPPRYCCLDLQRAFASGEHTCRIYQRPLTLKLPPTPLTPSSPTAPHIMAPRKKKELKKKQVTSALKAKDAGVKRRTRSSGLPPEYAGIGLLPVAPRTTVKRHESGLVDLTKTPKHLLGKYHHLYRLNFTC